MSTATNPEKTTRATVANFIGGTVEAMNPVMYDIEISGRNSQETPCFYAKIAISGQVVEVRNEGHGGGNIYYPHLTADFEVALDKLAAANLPAIDLEDGSPPLPMNFETWTFGVAYEKLDNPRLASVEMIATTKNKKTLSISEFFALPEVIRLQGIQKKHRHGTKAHRNAFGLMRAIAENYETIKGNSLAIFFKTY